MVVNSKKKSGAKGKKVKVLRLKKETVKNLSGAESKRVKGASLAARTASCPATGSGGSIAASAGAAGCQPASAYTLVPNQCSPPRTY